MLLVQELLHTFLLVVNKGSTADLIHEEQNRFVTIPQILLDQDSHPKLQNGSGSDTTGPGALRHMTLTEKNKRFQILEIKDLLFFF